MSDQGAILHVEVGDRRWMDLPTPQGRDLQVRWAGHVGRADAEGLREIMLEVRVKPDDSERCDGHNGCADQA